MNPPNQTVVAAFQPVLQPLIANKAAKLPRFYLAVSGGMDSMVLLDAWLQALKSTFHAESILKNTTLLHVHHGLQADADQWFEFCQQKAADYGLAFKGVRIRLEKEVVKQFGLEQAARKARRQVFQKVLQVGDYLITAHHQGDQSETLLLNLFRGAGVAGLQGMQTIRDFPLLTGTAKQWRPFLNLPYALLQQYAATQALHWQEDPSNQDLSIRRNFIRHQLLPCIQQQWSQAENKLAETCHWMQEANLLLQSLSQQDLNSCQERFFPVSDLMPETHSLFYKPLKDLPFIRQKNALRHWIAQITGFYPSQQQLQNIRIQILENVNPQTQPKIQLGRHWWIRSYQETLYLIKEKSFNNNYIKDIFNAMLKDKRFQAGGVKICKDNHVQLVDLSQLNWQTLQQAKQSADFSNRDRYKKWFQLQQIPPWERPNWPGAWLENKQTNHQPKPQFILAGMPELAAITLTSKFPSKDHTGI